MKLGGGQKFFIFRGCLPYEGVVRKRSFSGGLALWGEGEVGGGMVNFLEGGSYPSAYYVITISAWVDISWVVFSAELS